MAVGGGSSFIRYNMEKNSTDQDALFALAARFCKGGTRFREIKALGAGNINDTYLVLPEGGSAPFVLQKINQHVFPASGEVIANAAKLYRHLSSKNLPLQLLEPVPVFGNTEILPLTDSSGACWRAFRYIDGTVSYEYALTPALAFEASRAMGSFLAGLSDMDPALISEVIPHFHDGMWRFERFGEAVRQDIAGRRRATEEEIAFALEGVEVFQSVQEANFPVRVVHNDAKMGNFLFDGQKKSVVAVIDWDTVMPGALVSDFGDMVRTMTASLSENDDRFDEVAVREEWFEALVKGFIPPLKDILRPEELEGLLLGAKWIILEQMIRFLGDYLNGDTYYKVRFPGHNLVRARNQMALYRSLVQKESRLEQAILEVKSAFYR